MSKTQNLHKVKSFGRMVRVHRAVIEQLIGAPLPASLTVHHIDGNPTNNHRDNLAIATQAGHRRIHALQDGKNINELTAHRHLTCQQCEQPFRPRQERVTTAKYCSTKCAHAAKRITRTCPHCGARFWRPNPTTYCSRSCRQAATQSPATTKTYTCKHCQKPFRRPNPSRPPVYCSSSCQLNATRKPHPCTVCGTPITGPRRTCSDTCHIIARTRPRPRKPPA